MKRYDAIVIGAGAAGIFAARELAKAGKNVLLLEKGKAISSRMCPKSDLGGSCRRCISCEVLSGWGGAGVFSDGKLGLSPEVGGMLSEFIAPAKLNELIKYVDKVYRSHGAPDKVHGRDCAKLDEIEERARRAGLRLVRNPIRHMGTEVCRKVLTSLFDELSSDIEILFGVECDGIFVERGAVKGVFAGGEHYYADAVVIAPGRLGAQWAQKIAAELNIPTRTNPVDIGVRVECPSELLQELTASLYEAKLYHVAPTFRDEVRTFCMNPGGEVVLESYASCISVNGHAYADSSTSSTNFALLVKTDFTEPFNDPIAYGESVAKMANLLGNGVLVQRFADLLSGRRSTRERLNTLSTPPTLADAAPGDLSFALPHRHIVDIMETLQAMDALCPGLAGPDTLLYGAEVKFYSNRLQMDNSLQTSIRGLYGAGDGVGLTRGLVQASASGVFAARAVLAGSCSL